MSLILVELPQIKKQRERHLGRNRFVYRSFKPAHVGQFAQFSFEVKTRCDNPRTKVAARRSPGNTHSLRASRQVKLPRSPIGGAGTALHVILHQGRALSFCLSVRPFVRLSVRSSIHTSGRFLLRGNQRAYISCHVNGSAPRPLRKDTLTDMAGRPCRINRRSTKIFRSGRKHNIRSDIFVSGLYSTSAASCQLSSM